MEDQAKPFIEAYQMTREDYSTQAKVGVFILIGLSTVALMVVYFGRMGEGFSDFYNVRVEFANASGLLRGSEVLLAGAKIGRMTSDPIIRPDMRGIYVDLRIMEQVRIPVGSDFVIGSSGLLGDKYIQINLKKGVQDQKVIEPDSTVKGSDVPDGIEGMASGAGDLIAELRATIGNVNSAVTKINDSVLTKDELQKITDTIKNLHITSEKIAEASLKADSLMAQANLTVKSSQGAVDSAKKAADEFQKTLTSVRTLVDQVSKGKGALGMLISNPETAENIRALILNLRQHGILWYKDSKPPKAGDAPAE